MAPGNRQLLVKGFLLQSLAVHIKGDDFLQTLANCLLNDSETMQMATKIITLMVETIHH